MDQFLTQDNYLIKKSLVSRITLHMEATDFFENRTLSVSFTKKGGWNVEELQTPYNSLKRKSSLESDEEKHRKKCKLNSETPKEKDNKVPNEYNSLMTQTNLISECKKYHTAFKLNSKDSTEKLFQVPRVSVKKHPILDIVSKKRHETFNLNSKESNIKYHMPIISDQEGEEEIPAYRQKEIMFEASANKTDESKLLLLENLLFKAKYSDIAPECFDKVSKDRKNKKYACKKCVYTSAKTMKVAEHYYVLHSPAKYFVCFYCNDKFSVRNKLKAHLLSVCKVIPQPQREYLNKCQRHC